MSNSELAASYAALILADDGVDITVRLPIQQRFPSRPCNEPTPGSPKANVNENIR